MKTFAKVVSVALVAVMLLCVLASCGTRLNGTYEDKLGLVEITFKGDKITYKALGAEVEGTYEIKGDKITISLPNTPINGTVSFEKDGKTINIGGAEYTKK